MTWSNSKVRFEFCPQLIYSPPHSIQYKPLLCLSNMHKSNVLDILNS